MSRYNVIALLFLIAMHLSGCSSSMPKADLLEDKNAKLFQTESERANIYIYREPMAMGSLGNFDVSINGDVIGDLATGTYFRLQVPSGMYRINAKSAVTYSGVNLAVEEGQNYFVDVRASETDIITVSDEETGQNGVRLCDLLTHNSFRTLAQSIEDQQAKEAAFQSAKVEPGSNKGVVYVYWPGENERLDFSISANDDMSFNMQHGGYYVFEADPGDIHLESSANFTFAQMALLDMAFTFDEELDFKIEHGKTYYVRCRKIGYQGSYKLAMQIVDDQRALREISRTKLISGN